MHHSPSELALTEFRKRLEQDPDVPTTVRESLPAQLGDDGAVDLAAFLAAIIAEVEDESRAATGE